MGETPSRVDVATPWGTSVSSELGSYSPGHADWLGSTGHLPWLCWVKPRPPLAPFSPYSVLRTMSFYHYGSVFSALK